MLQQICRGRACDLGAVALAHEPSLDEQVPTACAHHRRFTKERATWLDLPEERHCHRHRHEEALASQAEHRRPHDVVEACDQDSTLDETGGVGGFGPRNETDFRPTLRCLEQLGTEQLEGRRGNAKRSGGRSRR